MIGTCFVLFVYLCFPFRFLRAFHENTLRSQFIDGNWTQPKGGHFTGDTTYEMEMTGM